MKSTGARKKYKIRDRNLPCDVPNCGKYCPTPQALFAHRRLAHNIKDKAIPDSEVRAEQVSTEDTIKSLRTEVAQLKLEKEKRQLTAELPGTKNEPRDMMAQAGLGNITGEAQTLAQMRVLGVRDQGQAQTWIDKLLSNPAGLKVAIDGLRGILGTDHNNPGDNTAALLKDLGFNLKDLILGASSPKAGSLSIAGVSLEGVSLSPELLQGILQYKAAEVKAQSDAQGKQAMADELGKFVKTLTSGLVSRSRGGGAGQIMSQEIISGSEPGEEVVICPLCAAENRLPADLIEGMEIHCSGKDSLGNDCKEVWHAVVDQPKPQRQAKKRQVEVEEPPTSIPCEACGQMLSIAGKPLGSELVCPICQRSQFLMSPVIAMDPELPEQEQNKFLHR